MLIALDERNESVISMGTHLVTAPDYVTRITQSLAFRETEVAAYELARAKTLAGRELLCFHIKALLAERYVDKVNPELTADDRLHKIALKARMSDDNTRAYLDSVSDIIAAYVEVYGRAQADEMVDTYIQRYKRYT